LTFPQGASPILSDGPEALDLTPTDGLKDVEPVDAPQRFSIEATHEPRHPLAIVGVVYGFVIDPPRKDTADQRLYLLALISVQLHATGCLHPGKHIVEYMRRTIVVHTRPAGHRARVDAARADVQGTQILTTGQLAARLAGGFLAPIDPDRLRDAVREALPDTDLVELEDIKTLPGMMRAAVGTLDRVWRADIDLSSSSHPRLKALAALERNVLCRTGAAWLIRVPRLGRFQPLSAPRWR